MSDKNRIFESMNKTEKITIRVTPQQKQVFKSNGGSKEIRKALQRIVRKHQTTQST